MRRQRWPWGSPKQPCHYAGTYTEHGEVTVEGVVQSLRGTTWNNYFSLMATRSQFNHKAIYEAILVVQPVLLETSGALPFCEACALKMRRIYIYIYKHRTC